MRLPTVREQRKIDSLLRMGGSGRARRTKRLEKKRIGGLVMSIIWMSRIARGAKGRK
jgi:hypothetical protein